MPDTHRLRVEVEGPNQQVRGVLERLLRVVCVREDRSRSPQSEKERRAGKRAIVCVVEYEGEDIRTQVSRTVLDCGWELLELHSLEPTLEDLYLQLIHASD